LFRNTIVEFTGGDWILIGLVIFAMLALVMLFAKVRSGAAIVIGVGFSYLLSYVCYLYFSVLFFWDLQL